MTNINDHDGGPNGLSRRQALRRGAAVTAVVWAAPVVTSVGLTRAAAAATSGPPPVVVFQDGFEAESQRCTINYFSFLNWTVVSGSVDIVDGAVACFGLTVPGNPTVFVDLDGSTGVGGTMVTKPGKIPVTAGKTYTATFQLAGNQRNANPDTVDVAFGPVTASYSVPPTDLFTTRTLSFVAPSSGEVSLSFHDLGSDNQGALLDNVLVTEV